MATLQELQAQRQSLIAEIQRRRKAGQAETPGYSKRLQDVEAQLRQMRGGAAAPGTPSGPTLPAVAPVSPAPPLVGASQPLETPNQVINAQNQANQQIAQTEATMNRPNQNTPTGTREYGFDEFGRPIINDSLSAGQQKILNVDEQLSAMGRSLAASRLGGFSQGWNPETASRTVGATADDRARIEDSVFQRLTRDLSRNKDQEMKALEQSLYNRGIPVGSELYNNQMREMNQRYDDQIASARGQATQLGGEEMARQFAMQEQQIANQYDQSRGVRQQNLGETAQLQGFGSGLLAPNFTGFAPVSLPGTDIGGIASTFAQQELARKQLAEQRRMNSAQIGRMGGGGGGRTSSGAPVNNPFNNSLPPGVG